jgi:hypothetical protein
MNARKRAFGWGTVAALAGALCLVTGCPFHQSGSSSSSSTPAPSADGAVAGVKHLHMLGGGKGPPGLLEGGGRSSHEPEPDQESDHNHIPAPAFDWTNRTPGGGGGAGGGGRHHH